MLSLQIPSTERRVVGLCWEKLKPQGPNLKVPAPRPLREVCAGFLRSLANVRPHSFKGYPVCVLGAVDSTLEPFSMEN
jgi:hypothetical protein